MLPGVFFLLRRGKQIVLRVVIDHGLCQDLVVFVAFGGGQLGIHKGRDLIHVQIDIGNILGADIIYFFQSF